MKDYHVTVICGFSIQAENEGQAEDRAQRLADAVTLRFSTRKGKPPTWLGDQDPPDVGVEEQ
jgi:hypothetical protein